MGEGLVTHIERADMEGIGGLAVLWPACLLPTFLAWLLTLVLGGYVGLATMVAGASLVPQAALGGGDALRIGYAVLVALFLVFTAGPVLASLGMSVTDIRSTDMRSPFSVGFVGLENYTKLLGDPLFQKVMFNTFAYLVLGVPLTIVLLLMLFGVL